MSERLFNREWKVKIGTSATTAIETTDLHIAFTVEKSLDNSPNSASVTIFNLSEDNRKAIEALNLYDKGKKARQKSKGPKKAAEGRIRVELEAGYEGTRSLLFRGDLRWAHSTRSGGTWTTEIEGEDGGKTYLASRIAQSFPAGTRRYDVAVACAQAMGLGLGNLPEAIGKLSGTYSHGTVAHGWAADQLRGVLRASKVKYSIQNGVIQVDHPDFSRVEGLYVTPDTGLVGTPSIGPDGLVQLKTLLLPNLAPGQYLYLDSSTLKGTLRVERVTYTGAVRSSEWYASCQCLQPDSPLLEVVP